MKVVENAPIPAAALSTTEYDCFQQVVRELTTYTVPVGFYDFQDRLRTVNRIATELTPAAWLGGPECITSEAMRHARSSIQQIHVCTEDLCVFALPVLGPSTAVEAVESLPRAVRTLRLLTFLMRKHFEDNRVAPETARAAGFTEDYSRLIAALATGILNEDLVDAARQMAMNFREPDISAAMGSQ
jgi:hypothetical protein